jgi:hypothetical protein
MEVSEMSFEISVTGAEELSKRILGRRPSTNAKMYDDYHLMLMLGLAAGRPTSKTNSDAGESRNFYQGNSPPESYRNSWHNIVGLVINNVVRHELGDSVEKSELNAIIQTLVSGEAEDTFTDDFWDKINGFARTGALKICSIPYEPMTWDEFLYFRYLPLLEALSDDKNGDGTTTHEADLIEEWEAED